MRMVCRDSITDSTQAVLLSFGNKIELGSYALHSRFKSVVNFERNGYLIGLTNNVKNASPVNIVVRNLELATVESLSVSESELMINAQSLVVQPSHRYDSLFIASSFEKISQDNLSAAKAVLLQEGAPLSLAFLLDSGREQNFQTGFERVFMERMKAGVSLMFKSDYSAGVKAIKGCGFGLTPSGDDFVCGVLFALHFLQQVTGVDYSQLRTAIFESSLGGSIFSNTFLRLAYNGDFYFSIKEAAYSLLEKSKSDISKIFKGLVDTGETSGADLCSGFLMTINNLLDDYK